MSPDSRLARRQTAPPVPCPALLNIDNVTLIIFNGLAGPALARLQPRSPRAPQAAAAA